MTALKTPTRVAGVVAVGAATAAAELTHAALRAVPSLVHVIDQAVVRATPGPISRRAIETVGSADKLLLKLGTFAVLAALGYWLGPATRRRPWVGAVVFTAMVAVVLGCAATLDGVSIGGTATAAAVAWVVGLATLHGLLTLSYAHAEGPVLPGSGASRRGFLVVSYGVAAGAVLGVLGAPVLRGSVRRQQRADVVLPAPVERAGPAVADLKTPGITSIVTPNRTFYRIDEALIVPTVDLTEWRLRVTGMVDRPFELDFQQLLAEPLIERWITLACVSNEVGGELVGNARWLGVRLSSLLKRAGVQAGATQVVGRSVDGFTAGFPLEAAFDGRDALVAVGMNGEPLPYTHGFPARLVVPGLYGYVSATKWLREVHLTTWDFDPYWARRGWAKQGPIKVQSRIDTPRNYAVVATGQVPVAGVAWAPVRGIGRVEVRVNGAPWQSADLGEPLGDACWRQWQTTVDLPVGRHEIEVRATTADGLVQDEQVQPPFPSGATGLHKLTVRSAAPLKA